MSKEHTESAAPLEQVREYGVCETVPMQARHFKFIDMLSTWVGANVQPNTWALGGMLAASGLGIAAAITLVANPICYIFLGLMGFIGYKVSTSAMGLTRFSLGIRGCQASTWINTLAMAGWCIVQNYVAAISISYMLNAAFGMPCYGMPGGTVSMLIGALFSWVLTCLMVWVGGGKTLKIAERIGVVLMLFFSLWMTVKIFSTYNFADIIKWKAPKDAAMPLGLGIDNIAAFSLSWIPCAADYTRYCKTKRSATIAPILGATIGIYWFALVGTVGAIASAVQTGVFDPNAADPSSIAMKLGLGIPAFVVVVASTVTTNVISLYSGTYSALNSMPEGYSFKKMSVLIGILVAVLTVISTFIGSFLDIFYLMLDYLGLIFPALVAVMLVDYYLVRRGHYQMDEINKIGGAYWYSHGVNWYAMIAWMLGIACYYVCKQLPALQGTIGATFPSIFFTGIIYYLIAKLAICRGYYKDLQPQRL